MQDLDARSSLAAALASVACRELQEECMRIAANDFAELPRPRIFPKLRPLLPVIQAHAGDEGLSVLLEAIRDTADWQP
jgi:hypothetical protein